MSDGSGRDRHNLGRAFALFKAAGYELKGTQLTNVTTGRQFTFEILTTTRDQERLALAFVRSLKRVGIEARVRTVDATQFERRRIGFDFDMSAVASILKRIWQSTNNARSSIPGNPFWRRKALICWGVDSAAIAVAIFGSQILNRAPARGDSNTRSLPRRRMYANRDRARTSALPSGGVPGQ